MSPDSLNAGTFSATAPSLENAFLKSAPSNHKNVTSKANSISLAGTITFTGHTATLKLDNLMPQNTLITVTIGTGVKNLANQFLAQPYVWSFTTGTNDAPPTIVSTIPTSGAVGVSPSATISATFNKVMNAGSFTPTTFNVKAPSGLTVPGAISYTGNTATFTPTAPLAGNTLYTANVTSGVKDVAGTFLANNYSWTFTTSAIDVAPTILSTVPLSLATGVSISSKVTATFSEAMNATTINSSNFTLTPAGGGPVPATVTYANNAAVLDPTAPLLGSTVYTAVVTNAVKDVAGTSMVSNYTWQFTTASTDIAPTIVSTIPAANAIGVSTNSSVLITFSEAMNAASINGSTCSLAGPNNVAVSANVTYANDVATIVPSSPLAAATKYTATVSTGVKDIAGTPMANTYTWSFTTDLAPTVTSTTPAAGAVNVLLNSTVTATFSEPMNASTISGSTFTVSGPGNVPISGAVTYLNGVATMTPTNKLAAGTVYTATVTTGAKNLTGTGLATAYTWTFLTDTPPVVVSTFPVNNQTQVGVGDNPTATFNVALNPATVTDSTFTLIGPGNVAVPATVSYVNKLATLTPTTNLAGITQYTATITTGVKNVAGTPLANKYTWQFTTGQATINLGTAGTYGVLAGSTVTNTGPTIIKGDLGVSPGTAVTGFPPGTFTGVEHAGDAPAATAKADLLAAYTDASTRLNANALPGDISGMTITPGLYSNSSSVMLGVGSNVTFDAQGDPGATFIIQMGSTLTTGVGSTMTLIGGTKATNIFWSVGSSATLGVNSTIVGNVLASASITAQTGAALNGRLLTNIAAVSLDSNNVAVPPRSRIKAASSRTRGGKRKG